MTALRTEVADHPSDRPARPAGGQAHQARQDLPGRRSGCAAHPTASWVDAKSVVKVMGLKLRTGTLVELEARGRGRRGGAGRAARPGRARLRRGPWLSGSTTAAPASPGLAIGPLVRPPWQAATSRTPRAARTERGAPTASSAAHGAWPCRARAAGRAPSRAWGRDPGVPGGAARRPGPDRAGLCRDRARRTGAAAAWRHCARRARSPDYEAAEDDYFRARASDLRDLQERVLAALGGARRRAPTCPPGAIVLDRDLTPSRFLALDWARLGGAALEAGSPSSHVAMLARARGVPLVTGLGECDRVGGRRPCSTPRPACWSLDPGPRDPQALRAPAWPSARRTTARPTALLARARRHRRAASGSR